MGFIQLSYPFIKAPTSPVSKKQNGSDKLVSDQGWHRTNRYQPQTASQRTTTNDAELYFTGDDILSSSNKPVSVFIVPNRIIGSWL